MSTADAPVGLTSDQLAECPTVEALLERLEDSRSLTGRDSDFLPWLEEGAVTEMDRFAYYHVGMSIDNGVPLSDDSPCFLLLWKVQRRYFARQLTRAEAKRLFELFVYTVQ